MPRYRTAGLPDGIPDRPPVILPGMNVDGSPRKISKNKGKPRPETARAKELRRGLTTSNVCNAIIKERGLLNEVAETLGVTRATIRTYIGKHDICARTLKEARQIMGDVAERKLYELIEAGDVRCIMYYLSTVHKARGYGMKRKDEELFDGKTQISTINIIAIPDGQYLPPDEPKQVSYRSRPVTVDDRQIDFPFDDAQVVSEDAPQDEPATADCLT